MVGPGWLSIHTLPRHSPVPPTQHLLRLPRHLHLHNHLLPTLSHRVSGCSTNTSLCLLPWFLRYLLLLAYKERFKHDFRGPTIPFGAKVSYKPSGEKSIEDMPKLGTKLRDGIFVGYDQIAGGGWSGDVCVLGALQLAASESIYQVYVR